jgi:hypothetical protein
LVGRARDLALLYRHLAKQGPPVLFLAGEPGIGKSRLLREATLRAASAGLRVLQGGCDRRVGRSPTARSWRSWSSTSRSTHGCSYVRTSKGAPGWCGYCRSSRSSPSSRHHSGH